MGWGNSGAEYAGWDMARASDNPFYNPYMSHVNWGGGTAAIYAAMKADQEKKQQREDILGQQEFQRQLSLTQEKRLEEEAKQRGKYYDAQIAALTAKIPKTNVPFAQARMRAYGVPEDVIGKVDENTDPRDIENEITQAATLKRETMVAGIRASIEAQLKYNAEDYHDRQRVVTESAADRLKKVATTKKIHGDIDKLNEHLMHLKVMATQARPKNPGQADALLAQAETVKEERDALQGQFDSIAKELFPGAQEPQGPAFASPLQANLPGAGVPGGTPGGLSQPGHGAMPPTAGGELLNNPQGGVNPTAAMSTFPTRVPRVYAKNKQGKRIYSEDGGKTWVDEKTGTKIP